MSNQKILIVVGPTASGKSALAVELAHTFDGEVISADSRQVYRGLTIGTGKITPREMDGVPHHLLDVASSRKKFNADDYTVRAHRAIAGISKHKKLPIIAGGTGFYIDALVGRITMSDVAPNPTLRKKLADKSAEQLFKMLEKKDSARAIAMSTPSERNNKVRLIRALEVAAAKPASTKVRPLYDALWIGITPTTKILDGKIATRLSYRLKHGMIAEAKHLHESGLSYKRMEELGLEYRSLARFLQKEISRAELEAELLRDISRYAKKQMVYWKRNKDITWFKPNQGAVMKRRVSAWLRS